jgi:hypothetical protein
VEGAIEGARKFLGRDVTITYVALPPFFTPVVEA